MMKKHNVILFSVLTLISLLLAACTQLGVGTSPLSPMETFVPTATATSVPVQPAPTSRPTMTPFPTYTPWPSPVPTLAPSALSPEAIAVMAVWEEADSGTEFALYQISQTPLGVASLEWSPDGRNLWLNVATGLAEMDNSALTTSLIVDRDSHKGWTTSGWGDSLCSPVHDWSPGGRQLAYIRDKQLWLAGADGGDPHPLPLPPEAEEARHPFYSPAGASVAFLTMRIANGCGYYDLWLLDTATETQTCLIEDAGYGQFTWSPSGNALAHVGQAHVSSPSDTYPIGAARLWLVEIASGRTVFADLGPLPGTEGCLSPPTWLLGGEKVLATILLTPGVWIVDLDGNVKRLDERNLSKQIERPSGPAAPHLGGFCDSAVASPDGRYVVYTAGGTEMYVIDLHTGSDLALGSGDLCHGAPAITWAPKEPKFLRWGRYLPFELVDATDGSVQQLAPSGLWPAWSPDSQRVAYWQPETDGYALWLLNLNDLKSVRLTSPSPDDPWQWERRMPFFYDIVPHWSPDGNSIAVVSFRGERSEAYLLQLTDNILETAPARQTTNDGELHLTRRLQLRSLTVASLKAHLPRPLQTPEH